MGTIAVSERHARLMKVLKEVENGPIIDITSRGKNVAQLVPPNHYQKKAQAKLREVAKNAVLGDVVSPIDSDWKSTKE